MSVSAAVCRCSSVYNKIMSELLAGLCSCYMVNKLRDDEILFLAAGDYKFMSSFEMEQLQI